MNVIEPSVPMRSKPSKKSGLETECLFGETIKILDHHSNWYNCQLLTDNYIGWVEEKYLSNMLPSSHRVISKRTFLFKNNDVKSGCINYLPMGAQVCVKDIDKKWAKVYLCEDNVK